MDSLANPSVQHGLSMALAAVAAAAVLTFVATALGARRAKVAATRIFLRRAALVAAFMAVAAGAAFALLSTPVETGTPVPPAGPPAGEPAAGVDVSSPARFSSAKLPALSLDAPAGWRLELDAAAHKLAATSGGTRLLISTAILTEAVDAGALLAQLAQSQRALGFAVGDAFPDRLGDLPATGFLATAGSRSVAVWMVKRDLHLASSVICSTDGKPSAREACRAPLATLRWRAPAPAPAR
ncbi:MAG TPA: hypothetical protein VIF57_29930 [Polyangia bacterium]